jgi:nucleotidyltransferase/DNA polymerase involved in DNA repair
LATTSKEQFEDSNTPNSDWTNCGSLLPKIRASFRAQASRRSRQRDAHVETAWAFSLERSSDAPCGHLEGKKLMPKSASKSANKSTGKGHQY